MTFPRKTRGFRDPAVLFYYRRICFATTVVNYYDRSIFNMGGSLGESTRARLKTRNYKVTERAQNADFRRKPQIFAGSPLLLEILAFGSEELKKAVAVSEEKIQHRSRRRGRFSGSRFPCRRMPKPWQG